MNHLKEYYRNLQKEITQAHEIAKKIWRIPELNDYIKEKYPKIYRNFKGVLDILGY